jgi:DNA-binding response OmpR family regulator
MGASILVVDDQEPVRRVVRSLLERAGHRVTEAGDGLAALELLADDIPDAVLLDVTMPGMDGWKTLGRIRELSDVPVLMLTGRGAELERVRGLRAGADDYLVKPFGRQELVARVEVLLRRSGGTQELVREYHDAWLDVDLVAHTVRAGGREVDLSPTEFRLLAAFVRHPNELLTRDRLLELVWGSASATSQGQARLYVAYLRTKLGPGPDGDSPIQTVRGFGYRYAPPSSA